MKTIQIELFEQDRKDHAFSPFKAMQRMTIDDIFCRIGQFAVAVVTMIGLAVIVSGSITTVQREEETEQVIYRRHEEDSLLKEDTPDMTDFDRLKLSANHKRMIIRHAIQKRRERNRGWAKQIDSTLNAQQHGLNY